jgi:hypothetical protein
MTESKTLCPYCGSDITIQMRGGQKPGGLLPRAWRVWIGYCETECGCCKREVKNIELVDEIFFRNKKLDRIL